MTKNGQRGKLKGQKVDSLWASEVLVDSENPGKGLKLAWLWVKTNGTILG